MAKAVRKPVGKPQAKRKNKQHTVAGILMRVGMVALILFCTVSIVTVQNRIVEKKKDLAALNDSIEALTAQNEELSALIDSDDISRYMEKLAIENGYAYPDERRYYDTSRD